MQMEQERQPSELGLDPAVGQPRMTEAIHGNAVGPASAPRQGHHTRCVLRDDGAPVGTTVEALPERGVAGCHQNES